MHLSITVALSLLDFNLSTKSSFKFAEARVKLNVYTFPLLYTSILLSPINLQA